MVELLMLIMVVYTISKALRRTITPLWTALELAAWGVLSGVLWYAERLFGIEAVLTVIVGALIIIVWVFGRHVRALREDVSQLNEAIARQNPPKAHK